MHRRPSLTFVAAMLPLLWSAVATARTWVVNNRHPSAADGNAGSEQSPMKTVNAAAAKAQPGDTILVHEGVYRERVTPPRGGESGRPITYEAAQPGKVFVRASDEFKGAWEPLAGQAGVYKGTFDAKLLADYNPFKTAARGSSTATCGQVIVDGSVLQEQPPGTVPSKPNAWSALPGGAGILVSFPAGKKPADCLVEVSTRNVCFAPKQRGLGYITVRGFVFEHAANESPRGFYMPGGSQIGALSCRAGHHWIIENNVIRYAKNVGIDVGSRGRESDEAPKPPDPPRDQVGHHLIRNNVISDNGSCGICGLNHSGVKVIGNVLERNGYLGLGGAEAAGIKFHLSSNAWIEGNLVRDSFACGIWLDNNNVASRVTRNVCINNEGMGIFVEMSNHPVVVDNNVIAQTCYSGYKPDPKGDGFYTHDAGGVTFVHNLSYQNVQFGCMMRIVTKRISMHSGQRFANNLLLDNPAGEISIPYPGPKAKNNTSDCNVFAPGVFEGKTEIWPHRFVVTTMAGAKMADIQAAFAKACPGEPFKPTMNREARRGQSWVPLTADQWRKLMGFDTHSQVAKLGQHSLGRDLTLVLEIDDAPWRVPCKPVAGVDKDFFGKPIPRDKPLPGPFQGLQKGKNRFVIWPVPDTGPNPPPASARPAPQQGGVSGSVLEE